MDKHYHRNTVQRTLMGPGPSTVSPRVLRAMSEPTMGHLDPNFLAIMTDTMELLRYVFTTNNQLTVPMSGTGSAGMETVFVNLLEPGDKVIVCIHGLFGQRMADVASRCGAEVIEVHARWGTAIDPAQVKEVFAKHKGVKAVCIVHAETSTGVLQPLEDISRIAKEHDALILVDAVTSLGGVEVPVDRLQLDLVYSGTQKCLSCPPGLAPVTFNEKAVNVLNNRKTKVQSWYLDLTMIQRYWGDERFYHHTAPVNMIYGLHEALVIIKEEGLENRFARHKLNSEALIAGVEAMGLSILTKPEYRLYPLNPVVIPEGINDVDVRKGLLTEYNLEIGGGLGELKGKIWRVGLMGYASTKKNVMFFLSAFADVLNACGYKADAGEALSAAASVYDAQK